MDTTTPWMCDKCHEALVLQKVHVRYLEGSFEVELLKCPTCKMVFISDELAMGKMLEVEKGLEDK
ncbi:MAG: DNA-binding protein [Campylobacterales bacterium]|nr:DNA-binding protein [Campylobacterales bacterium]MBN2832900.1 DNA-binding protein [Campylobacterales bacterium]